MEQIWPKSATFNYPGLPWCPVVKAEDPCNCCKEVVAGFMASNRSYDL